MRSALLVGGDEARLTRIVTEIEGLGFNTFYTSDSGQALEALKITQFDALFCFDPASLGGLRKASGDAAEQCWFVAVCDTDSPSEPRVRISSGGGTDIEGADVVLEGSLAFGQWADVLGRFSAQKRGMPNEARRHESLKAFDRELFERQMSYDTETMAEIIHLYKRETARQLSELEKAIADGESERAWKLAHTLKGSFGGVCAPRASALAQEIEVAATDSNFSRVSELFQELRRAVSDSQAEMEPLLRS